MTRESIGNDDVIFKVDQARNATAPNSSSSSSSSSASASCLLSGGSKGENNLTYATDETTVSGSSTITEDHEYDLDDDVCFHLHHNLDEEFTSRNSTEVQRLSINESPLPGEEESEDDNDDDVSYAPMRPTSTNSLSTISTLTNSTITTIPSSDKGMTISIPAPVSMSTLSSSPAKSTAPPVLKRSMSPDLREQQLQRSSHSQISNRPSSFVDIQNGLIYRKPSVVGANQTELSLSRHKLKGATLPALLRRLTSLAETTRDDCWSFLCRMPLCISPVHFFCFLGARFFLNTFAKGQMMKPYTCLKTRKSASTANIAWSKIKKKVRGNKIPVSKDGEKLWLLDEKHVLGAGVDLYTGENEEEKEMWMHTTLLPIRCSVLTFLDIYLSHFGFKFEEEKESNEESTVLKRFLVDIYDSKALELWGWKTTEKTKASDFDNPKKMSSGLYKQFPAVASALCKVLKSDWNRTVNGTNGRGRRGGALQRRLSLADLKINLSKEFQNKKKQSSSSPRSKKNFVSRGSVEERKTLEVDFDSVVVEEKAPTNSSIENNSSSFDSVPEPNTSSMSSTERAAAKVMSPLTAAATQLAEKMNDKKVSNASALGLSLNTITLLSQQAVIYTAAEHTIAAEAIEKGDEIGAKILTLPADRMIMNMMINESLPDEMSEKIASTLAYSDKGFEKNFKSPFGYLYEDGDEGSVVNGRESESSALSTATTTTTTTATNRMSKRVKKRISTRLSIRSSNPVAKTSRRISKLPKQFFGMVHLLKRQKSIKMAGFGMFGSNAVANQLTLHLFYMFATIPLVEFVADLSFKVGDANAPYLSRFRSLSERLPSVIISAVLEEGTPEGRGKLIAFFVEVAWRLKAINSFHGLMLVVGALQSNAIHRLKKSWEVAYGRSFAANELGGDTNSSDADLSSLDNASSGLGKERDSEGLEDIDDGLNVKDVYAELLTFCGIGGRKLHQECHRLFAPPDDETGESRRITFPAIPGGGGGMTMPMMPFLNSSLALLIRLNELSDTIEVDGNAHFTNEEKFLNLSKMRRVASIVALLRLCQLTPFEIEPNVEIEYYLLRDYRYMDSESQYERSVELEPVIRCGRRMTMRI